MADQYTWWQRGTIYHVYPRSFQDSNGDGTGDLNGITSRLDYLKGLGVDALWISPIYPSPMADFGYDVSDYTGIEPIFGTLADFDRLVAEAHARGLRVLLDWVPNHTSDRHPWFVESRATRHNPKRDWYLWRDAAPGGGPPTNWVSMFGGSAWKWDEATGQYYYHTYLKQQPDLNWRNPEVRDAMLGTLRVWLERGVDGFRIDALRQVIKDDQYRDNPSNPGYRLGMRPYAALLPLYTTNRPEVHDVIRRVRELADAYGDPPLIGELYLPIEELVRYYGEGGSGLHLPANFHLLTTPWDARSVAALVDAYEAALPAYGWPTWVLSNHDNPRVAARIGAAQARVAALLLLTLRGTPTVYYGDELGMCDVPIPPERVQDPVARNLPGLGLGRDPERTPMHWDASANAGFTTGTPWLPLADDYMTANVAAEDADPRSTLALYRRLLALRRAEPALAVGPFAPIAATDAVFAYARTAPEGGGRRFVVALNFTSEPRTLRHDALRGSLTLSTHLDRDGEHVDGMVELRGNEGIVVDVPVS